MEKTLVVILSETRASELTYHNIKENVIDYLNADICVCIGIKDNYDYENPFYKIAKYRFLYNESNDLNFLQSLDYSYNQTHTPQKYEKLENINFIHKKIPKPFYSGNGYTYIGEYDSMDNFPFHNYPEYHSFVHHKPEIGNAYSKQLYGIKHVLNNWVSEKHVNTYVKQKHYMDFHKLKNHLLADTGKANTYSNFAISTYIHIFFLWFLQKKIQENNLLAKYDRFIIMRSDYIFKLPCPHPKLLDKKYIWIPDGEDHGGVCDRFVILSKDNIIPYVNILESFYLKSNKFYHNISLEKDWNMERILKMNLIENNILRFVRRIPYVMYSVRNVNGTTRWATGVFNKQLGYFIKYPLEFDSANNHYNLFKKSGKNIENYYRSLLGLPPQEEPRTIPPFNNRPLHRRHTEKK